MLKSKTQIIQCRKRKLQFKTENRALRSEIAVSVSRVCMTGDSHKCTNARFSKKKIGIYVVNILYITRKLGFPIGCRKRKLQFKTENRALRSEIAVSERNTKYFASYLMFLEIPGFPIGNPSFRATYNVNDDLYSRMQITWHVK
jgi:hypothetical protein